MKQRRPSIVAIRHEHVIESCSNPGGGLRITRAVLLEPPVAIVSGVESIMGLWWLRSGGYPVGRVFGTFIGATPDP